MSRIERMIVAVALATLGAGCHSELILPQGDAPPPPAVPRVEAGSSLDPDGYLGIVVAGRSIDIVAPEMGTVEEFYVDLGDFVDEDQLLFDLDSPDLEAEKKIALAQVAAQKAAAAQYGAAARRASHKASIDQKLVDQGYLAAETAIDTRASGSEARAAAGASIKQAHVSVAQVEHLAHRLERTSMTAPFRGRVAARYVDPGAVVGAGERLLRLVAEDTLEVRFAVPEAVAASLRLGTTLALCSEGEAQVVYAAVSRIAPEVDPASGMVFFEANVHAAQRRWLRAGTRVRVHGAHAAAC